MHACSVIYYHACNTVFTWTADMQRFLGAVALRFQSHSVLTPEVMHSVWQETPSCLTGLLLFSFIGIKFNLNKMRHCCPQVVWKSSAQDLWTRANRLPGEIFCWWHFDEIQGQCFFFFAMCQIWWHKQNQNRFYNPGLQVNTRSDFFFFICVNPCLCCILPGQRDLTLCSSKTKLVHQKSAALSIR